MSNPSISATPSWTFVWLGVPRVIQVWTARLIASRAISAEAYARRYVTHLPADFRIRVDAALLARIGLDASDEEDVS